MKRSDDFVGSALRTMIYGLLKTVRGADPTQSRHFNMEDSDNNVMTIGK
jgi:hypothetical protein